MNISPLGVLVALVVLGVTIEVVEQKSQSAAYALVILLLLGMVTFNSAAFTKQINLLIAFANAKQGAKPQPQKKK
jgi:hypothetical protein